MNIYAGYKEQARLGSNEMGCPYNGINVCMASFSSMQIDNRKRENYCGTDNFDNCPIFLSKVLRKVATQVT